MSKLVNCCNLICYEVQFKDAINFGKYYSVYNTIVRWLKVVSHADLFEKFNFPKNNFIFLDILVSSTT